MNTSSRVWTNDTLKSLVVSANAIFKKNLTAVEIDGLFMFTKQMKINASTFASTKEMCDFVVNSYKKYINSKLGVSVQDMLIEQINKKDTDTGNGIYGVTYGKSSIYANNHDDNVVQQQVQSQSLPSASELVAMTQILNRESLVRDSIVMFDSRYQNRSNTDRSRFMFSVISDTKNKTEGSGTLISLSRLTNIVEMEIFPFSIPYLTAADNYYNKITMSFPELASSSIDAYEDARFHFMFRAEKNMNLLDLTPMNNIFRFHTPFYKVTDFSIRFGSPLAPITFDKDMLPTTDIDYTSNPMVITFGENHNLISGDLLYLSDFTTADPAKDLEIINTINSPYGHRCTRISSTSVSINVDANLIQYPDMSHSSVVYLGSKRIMFMLRFRFMGEVGHV